MSVSLFPHRQRVKRTLEKENDNQKIWLTCCVSSLTFETALANSFSFSLKRILTASKSVVPFLLPCRTLSTCCLSFCNLIKFTKWWYWKFTGKITQIEYPFTRRSPNSPLQLHILISDGVSQTANSYLVVGSLTGGWAVLSCCRWQRLSILYRTILFLLFAKKLESLLLGSWSRRETNTLSLFF